MCPSHSSLQDRWEQHHSCKAAMCVVLVCL